MTNSSKLLGFCAFAKVNADLLYAIIASASEKTKSKKDWYAEVKKINPDMSFEDEELFVSVLEFIYTILEHEELKYYN